ncbi:MAG TPA: hypothetical protein VFZ08_06575 [Terriglobia bacterium]|nr:hypothetical protein [Terriglobia bacterium]
MDNDEYPLRWFQCAICGRMLDSEDAQIQHERKCRRDFAARRWTDKPPENPAVAYHEAIPR